MTVPYEGQHDADASCACRAVHAPEPLTYQWHHIRPKAMGGEDTKYGILDRNGIWLCSTTHDNVHEILRLMVGYQRLLTWGETAALKTRPLSRYAHALACEGYIRWRSNEWSAL